MKTAKKRLSRRGWVRIISYTAALVVALSASTAVGYTLAYRNRTAIEYGYQRALGELTEYIGNIDITLEKGQYATSPNQLEGLAANLRQDAELAKMALAQLPSGGNELSGTYKFLSQVGSFCTALADRVAEGGTITDAEIAALEQLSGYASELAGALAQMESDLEGGQMVFGEVAEVTNLYDDGAGALPEISSGFRGMEEGFEDYPTLIYDGPFSDHLLEQEPKLLAGMEEVGAERALDAAVRLTGLSTLKADGESAGRLPCYVFSDGTARVTVTKQGGIVSSYTDYRTIEEAALSTEQALQRGKEVLAAFGYEGFAYTYFALNNGVMTINFACQEDGVVYYPDLIKLGVAMDNGDVVLFEATGYIVNHTVRTLPAPQFSAADAQAKLSKNLTPRGEGRLALIPAENTREVLCYEFACTGKKEETVLVYVNVETGLEEQILILLEDETGTLAF